MVRPVDVTWRIRGPNGEDLKKMTSETEVDDKIVNTVEKMMENLRSEIKEAYGLRNSDMANLGIVDWKFTDTDDKVFNVYEDETNVEQPVASVTISNEELSALHEGIDKLDEEEPNVPLSSVEHVLKAADECGKITAMQAFHIGTIVAGLVTYGSDANTDIDRWRKLAVDEIDRLVELKRK